MKTRRQRNTGVGPNREDIYMDTQNGAPRRARRNRQDVGIRRHREAPQAEQRDVEHGHDVMRVTSVAHKFLAPGVVVRAYFPYTEAADGKFRPAVVVAKHGQVVTLIALTTSRRATHATDVLILDLQEAGLNKATRARTANPECVDRAKVINVLGRLSPRDFTRILMIRNAA